MFLLPRLLARQPRLYHASLFHVVAQQQNSLQGSCAAICCGQQQSLSKGSLGTPAAFNHRSMSSLTPDNVAKLSASFNALPHSLRHERPPLMPLGIRQSYLGRMALKLLMFDNAKNQHIIHGQQLYDAIKEQVDDFALQRAFGLDPKIFYSTFTLLSIHVWLIVNRLCYNPDRETRFFVQRFYNQFQHDVERRIYEAGVMILAKESNDTFENVILRKFFGGDTSKRVHAQLIAKYLLYEHECLKITDKQDIMKGHIQFSRFPFEEFRRSSPSRRAQQAAAVQEAGGASS
ncbi:hypothetical protein DUNSADRAFT_11401 [Dunaliella salina]|uniref:Ubiquinol-cytochrome c chaperone domain-containing protein n=1 Tax=Dunaliella salina TaxID=3046 RepID=A0ABQ7GDG4_DUNSA|nr:hypothetical protein DUNSADRAFT_11401 [Dunaliella salina]|eukprot:KAF5832656.1 hypothetical protein DUNSADRAFT_11401 [Dunaliella salina]